MRGGPDRTGAIAQDMEKQLLPASTTALAVLGWKSATREERINALEMRERFLKNPSEWGQLIVREQLHLGTALVIVNQVLGRL
jgi:hypothetical protein